MPTSLAGKDVNFYVRHATYTNNEWWVAVCAIQTTLSEAKAESTVVTKCGSITTPGSNDDSISLDITYLTSEPAATEITAELLKELYRSGDVFDWRMSDANVSGQYVDDYGQGVGTSCTSTYPAEGFVNVAFEFKVNGDITSLLP